MCLEEILELRGHCKCHIKQRSKSRWLIDWIGFLPYQQYFSHVTAGKNTSRVCDPCNIQCRVQEFQKGGSAVEFLGFVLMPLHILYVFVARVMNKIHNVSIFYWLKIKLYTCYTVNIYKNKPVYFFQKGGGVPPGAPVLDPPFISARRKPSLITTCHHIVYHCEYCSILFQWWPIDRVLWDLLLKQCTWIYYILVGKTEWKWRDN